MQELLVMRVKDLVWVADSFGETIRRAREAKELTQREVAARCGNISTMYISQIETGKRIPQPKICWLLARELDLDEQRLILLAISAKMPKEFQDLLAKEEQVHKADVPVRVRRLVEAISKLPEEKKLQVARAWEEILKLVVSAAH